MESVGPIASHVVPPRQYARSLKKYRSVRLDRDIFKADADLTERFEELGLLGTGELEVTFWGRRAFLRGTFTGSCLTWYFFCIPCMGCRTCFLFTIFRF